MPTAPKLSRIVPRIVLGTLLGLVAVEAGLQGVRLAVAVSDAGRTHHALAQQGGDLRVLCLGACYTIGIGTPSTAAYPAVLEQRLDALLADSGTDAVVVNGGQRGKSIDHFARTIEPLLEAHQPDIVVIGVNRRTDDAPADLEAPGLLDRLILPRMVALALTPRPSPSPITHDALAVEIDALTARLSASPDDRDAWRELSTLHARRGDYTAARDALDQIAGPTPRPPVHLTYFRYAIALGEHAVADRHLAAVRRAPQFVERMAVEIRERRERYAAEGRNAQLREQLDLARLAVVREDLEAAQSHIDEVLRLDPDTADAWHLQAYLDHCHDRPPRRRADAFLGEHRSGASASTDSLQRFRGALDRYVAHIQAAAAHHDAVVVLHTLAATPDQIPVIQAVGAERGVPVIDVQTALAQVHDPEPLFHPTDHLRLSEAGNAWLAAEIHAGLAGAGLVPGPGAPSLR